MQNFLFLLILFFITLPFLGKSFYNKKNMYGILLTLAIGFPAYFLGKQFPIIGGPVFGILLGILFGTFNRPETFNPGIRITGKKILQSAIVLLGFGMHLKTVLEVGSASLAVLIITTAVCLISAYFLSKKLKVEPNLGILVGVGTSICGGSAIAATAPVIKAEDDEVATAISIIFLFNIMAVFIFPALGHIIGMSDTGFGIWAGTAINDTSSVVAASYSFSDAAGELATIVKLTRTLMIIPITFILALYTAKKTKSEHSEFSIVKIFPWFVLGFVFSCILNTAGIVSPEISSLLSKTGKLFIVLAMTAIGLNTNLKKLLKSAKKPLLLGAMCWAIVSITSLVVQYFNNLL